MFFSTLFFGKNLPGELIPVAVQTEVNFNDVNLESILLPAFPDTLIVPGRDFDFNSEQSNQNLNLDQLRSGGISPSIDNNIPGERGSFQPSAPFSGELQDFGGSTFNFSPSTGQAPLSDPLRSYEANYDYSKKFSIDSPTGVGMDFAPLSPNELVSQLGTNENFTPLGTFDFSNISFVSGRGRRSLRRDSSRRLEEQQDLVVSEDAALLAPAPAIIAPRGLDDIYVTFRDLALNTLPGNGVLSNDIAGSGGVVRSNLINYPGGGALTLNPDGSFSYTPPAGFAGRETFTYELTNGTQTSGPVTVTLDVIVPNIAPVALGNTYSINEDNTLNVPVNGVLGNDLDPDGPNPLSAQLVSGPANGSLTLNADGSFSYTPNANYAGGDSFTYRASDGVALSNVATVNITVNAQNDPPVTQNDTYSVNEDTTLNVAASGVLSNDSDPEGDALSAVLVSGPSNGSLTLNGNGSFSYTPNANFFGSDSFTYRANDGSVDSGVATANITVNAQNDPPVAFNNAYSVDENNVLSVGIVPGVLTNDGDLEGDPLSAILVSGPANGSLTLNTNGSFTYTPNANFFGADSFTYRANDGSDDSNIATVNITVNEENRPPAGPNANIQVLENNQNHSISPPLPSDPDGDPVTIRVVSLPDPAKGVVTLDDGTPVTVGQVLSNTDFSGLEFDTVSGQTGAAGQFVYSLDDGNNPLENRNFNFDIRPRNDPPVAQNDFYATNEDTTLNVPVNGVLGNDSDPDGPNPLSAQLVLGPANGNLTLNANGSFSYTPNANFFGNDSFTYRASDGSLNSSNATVSITVNARNDPPVAVNDLATTALNTAIAINVRANDTDIEDGVPGGSPLIVSGPSNGSVTINPTGNVVYTPDLGYTGTDSFTYRAVDSNGASSSNVATVSLNVTAVSNDLPVAPGGSLNVVEDSQNNNIGLAAPSDPDGDALTITVFSLPDPVKGDVTLSNGTPLTVGQTLSIAQLQSLQYDAALNATGAAGNFVYSVSDGVNPAVNGSVSFNISPVNDAPRLSFGDNESFGFAEQSTLFGDNYVPNNVLPSSYRPGVQTLEMETAGIVMQESRNVSVTFVSETSAEAGSLGWYIIDQATGEIQNPQIIWNSMDSGFLGGGTTVNLGNLNEGDQIGFFVVNDGFNQNNFDNPAGANYIDLANGSLFFGTAPGGAAATIYSSAPALWYVPTGNPGGAFQLNTSANGIYHTEAYQGLGNLSLNPDSHAHSKGEAYHSGGQFLIGIEAATNPTSNNTTFNDYVFRVNLGQETTQEIANHGNYDFEINDVDSDQLQRATFVIRNTPHAVNDKIGMTGYDVSGGGSSGSIAGTTLFISGLGTRSVTITGTEDIEVYESVLSSLRIFRSGRTQHPEPFAPGGAFPYVYRPGARELEVSVTDTNGAVSNILGPNNESDPFNDISANVNASWAVRSLGTGNNVESTGNSWTLLGNNGNDTLTGNGGFINIDGGQGNDVITGTNGAQDTLIGSAGNDTINGRGGDDIILGGIGIDIINGGSGDDYISGGQGTDEITLGSGSDYVVFMFDDVGNGVDIIFDFNVSDDVIDLSDVLDYEGGNLDFWVHAERNGAVTEISVDVDGPLNGANFVPIAVITNFLPVGSSINIDYGGGVAPIEVV